MKLEERPTSLVDSCENTDGTIKGNDQLIETARQLERMCAELAVELKYIGPKYKRTKQALDRYGEMMNTAYGD